MPELGNEKVTDYTSLVHYELAINHLTSEYNEKLVLILHYSVVHITAMGNFQLYTLLQPTN